MAFVVTDKCINCKFTDCVEVCPVDCFHEGPNMLVINPDECIDCALCEPECPAQAIVSEDELSEKEEIFKEINQKYSTKWPYISEHKPTTFDTGYWMSVEKTADMIKEKE